MNTCGKRARKASGLTRFELKRANRQKRHDRLNNADYNKNIGTNARLAVKRQSER